MWSRGRQDSRYRQGDWRRGFRLCRAYLAQRRIRKSRRLAGGASAYAPACPDRQHRDQRRCFAKYLGQICAGSALQASTPGCLERSSVAYRISACPSRDEFPLAAPAQGRQGQGRGLLYSSIQPGMDKPGGMSWIEMLKDESRIELHAALTPVWSEP